MTAPPPTRRDGVVDTLHGVEVPDPYRWLEAGDSAEVQQWVAAQNAHTREALDARPDRGWWHERLVALMQLPVVMAAQVRGDHLFCLERPAGAEQFLLTRRSARRPRRRTGRARSTRPSAPPTRRTPIDWFEASADGALVAVGTSEGGTEELRAARARRRRRPRPRRGDPAHPGLQRGLGARRLGLRLHPLSRGRPVPPHRAPPPPRRPLAGRSGACGPSTPTPRRGRTSRCRRTGRGCSSTSASVGPASTCTSSTGRTGTWTTVVEGVEATSELRFAADGDVARRRDDARRAARPRRARARSTRRPERRGRRSSPRVTPSCRTLRVAGDELLVVATTRAVDAVARYDADGRPLGVVDGLGDVIAVSRPRRRPCHRPGVRRRRLVRRSRRRSGARVAGPPAVRWSAPPTRRPAPCRR